MAQVRRQSSPFCRRRRPSVSSLDRLYVRLLRTQVPRKYTFAAVADPCCLCCPCCCIFPCCCTPVVGVIVVAAAVAPAAPAAPDAAAASSFVAVVLYADAAASDR